MTCDCLVRRRPTELPGTVVQESRPDHAAEQTPPDHAALQSRADERSLLLRWAEGQCPGHSVSHVHSTY